MSNELFVIQCPSRRCETCEFLSNGRCMKYHELVRSAKPMDKIVFVAWEKNHIYMGHLMDSSGKSPPWQDEGWESVYVAQDKRMIIDTDALIDVYFTGPYISIFQRDENGGVIHFSLPNVRTELEWSLMNSVGNKGKSEIHEMGRNIKNLTQKLTVTASEIEQHIQHMIPEMQSMVIRKISELAAYRLSVIGPMMSILLDDFVEEVYLDRPDTNLYFDHQIHGRCTSLVTVREEDISRFVTLLRAESNLHLDRRNPSLKTELVVKGVPLRIAATLSPLSADGFQFEIRKAKKKPFTLMDLVGNGTLPTNAAILLLLAVWGRLNITITGGPGTGKTTLLNALDISTPKGWRKIYIEDTLESRILAEHHQIRIKVDPVDELDARTDKSSEIIKTLHRSPDYLVLGEIQTSEHSKALFQAIAAGIRTLQTCHSDSASSLISRWRANHHIEQSSIAMMDLIVTLERPTPGESLRRVREISEIRRSYINGVTEFNGINRLYEIGLQNSEQTCWAEDGAFQDRFRGFRTMTLEDAYNNLVERIGMERNNGEMMNYSELYESFNALVIQ